MTSIFVSYSSKDISHVNSVSSIGSNNLSKNIDLWIATQKKDKISQLKPGEKWRDEIEKNINNSSGAVLLVSKNFLDAEIITNFELPLIIKKKEEDPSYKIYPLLLDECDYRDNSYLSSLQFSNSPNTFLKSLSVGAPLAPFFRIFSPRFRLAWMFAYNPLAMALLSFIA